MTEGARTTMAIRRLTVAAALGALLALGGPAFASATDTGCTPPGGLLGLSVDDCGINASVLGIDVGIGGSTAGSDDTTPDEAQPDEPAQDEPPSGAAGGSGSGGGSTSGPAQSVPADVATHDGSGPAAQDEGAPSIGGPDGRSAETLGSLTNESTRSTPAGGSTTDPLAAADSAGGGPIDVAASGQMRGPLAEIPPRPQQAGQLTDVAASDVPSAGANPVLAIALVAVGVLAAGTGVALVVRRQVTPFPA
jgi:hypothetical protein